MSKECPNCGSRLTKLEAERKKCDNCNEDLADELVSAIIGLGAGLLLNNIFDNSSDSSSSSLSSSDSSSFDGFGGGDFGGGGASSDF